MKNKFSQEEIEFIKIHYPVKGSVFCSNELKRTRSSIQNKAFRLGIKIKDINKFFIDKYSKSNDKFRVNADDFIYPNIPECVYILGLIWADGHIRKSGNTNSVNIKSTFPDGDEFYKIISKTGKWNYYKYCSKNKKLKPMILINTNNKPLVNFLIEKDYYSKSEKSAEKILSIIPENLKHHWFRGLVDGDGHITKDAIHAQVIITSSYNQDWKYVSDLYDKINISYSIKKCISKKGHRSSYIKISNRRDCLKFLDYIYKDCYDIKLNRKYERYCNFQKTSIRLFSKNFC